MVYRFSVDQDTALPLKALAAVYCHYYIVKVEEPYLTLVFGEEVLYRLGTPRYFGYHGRQILECIQRSSNKHF
ncbi:MAG TPA: hypothetical protein ENG07_00330 [Candidatus Bathyarchaeota archaeon]|nr:hypothetical protein [Candidatus Bathyarchaeota archaeon]